MAVCGFVDDSGSEPSQPVYVLGGLILPAEAWLIFAADWSHVLRSEPKIEYFKGSEVWDRRKGPFMDLSTKERSDKVDSLADVIFTYKPLSISTRVEWPIFKKFADHYSLHEEFNDPYFFLFFALIGQMVTLAEEQPKFSNVNFVFDGQGRVGIHAQHWYSVFLSYCTDRVKALLGNAPIFGDEKQLVPLQAADMFAWYQRRSVLGSLGHESHQRIWDRFHPLQYSTEMFEENLESLAIDMNFPKRS